MQNLTYVCDTGVEIGNVNNIFTVQTKHNFALETVTFTHLDVYSVNIDLIFTNKVISIQTLYLSVEDGGNVYISGNVTIGQINVDANTTLIDNR